MLRESPLLPSESPADYARVSREISQSDDLKDISIAFLSSYTSEVLKPYIMVELAKRGLLSSIYFAPFNHFEQEIINHNSGLYASEPDVVVIHNRIEDMNQDLLTRFYSYSSEALKNELASIIFRFREMIETLRENTNAQIVIINFAPTQDQGVGFVGSPMSHSQAAYIQRINDQLWQLCCEISSCCVISYQQLLVGTGLNDWMDSKLYFLGRIPFGGKAQIRMGKVLARTIAATFSPPCKCLVLDLDNTLWGGVLGEDGVSGVQLGDNYPGNVYKSFQRTILGLRDQGVLLAISSKNDYNDAIDLIEKHTDCLIKKEHLASIQINWNDKATSLFAIAKELNIGLDSIAFFDDNPVERDWIKDQLPEVKVINVPKNPMQYSRALLDSEFFDRLILTEEDRNRPEIYQHEQKRTEFHIQSKSVDDFLRNLAMKATIGCVDKMTISRVRQLIDKTNQFNVTCIRHSEEDIESIINNNGIAIWLSVEDRFGDSGIVGSVIAKQIGVNEWLIDTFLLSCRVIGRQLDAVLLNHLCQVVRKKGGTTLYGEYIPTTKNSLVNEFFPKYGFEAIMDKENYWIFNLSKNQVESPKFIKVELVE